jgi:outer membrane protein
VPFPQDAKYAFVDIQAIASNSTAGKAASARLQQLTEAKQKEIGDKSKQLQALTTKRDTSVGVMSEAARAGLDKDIDKLQREIQFANSSAQAEVNDLQNELQGEFQKKLIPIIEELAKEKGLYMIFTAESGFAYVNPGLNLSEEVIKRLDAKK